MMSKKKQVEEPEKKTPLGAHYIRQVVRANDQVCFAAFQQSEFLQLLAPLAANIPTNFTASVSPANPFAETIHRRMSELTGYAREAEKTALQMGVIAGVEYVISYLEEVQDLRRN